MPTFIDESGDSGPHDKGGKPYFRLAAVWVPSFEDADSFRDRVRSLRRELGLRSEREFKFATTHQYPELRSAFLEIALGHEFKFAFSNVDKTERFREKSELYWACATELAALLRHVYYKAEQGKASPYKEQIVVDDNEDAEFLTIIKKQFRAIKSQVRPGSSLIGKVSFRNSVPDEMIQLVDMVCGACGSAISDGDSRWYEMIAGRRSI